MLTSILNLADPDRVKKGMPMLGSDGFPMELHHPFGRDGYNYFIFEPLTKTEHLLEHMAKGFGGTLR